MYNILICDDQSDIVNALKIYLAPEGYQLLKEPILVKQLLPEDEFQASYQVVNDDVFRLPATGGSGFHSASLGVYLLCTALMLALFPMARKREG